MNVHEIPLARLQPHPHNSNVMPEPLLKKLAGHIARTDRYPPIIARPVHNATDTEADADAHTDADADAQYQILDGHHRVAALRRLGRDTARALIWHVNDDEALMLVATLNRLEGEDDPRQRAALLAKLHQRHALQDLSAQLPEPTEQLQKLMALDRPAPTPRAPQPIEQMPQAVHFFLLPEQRRRLDARLRAIGGAREAALMTLVDGDDASATG